MHINTIKYLNKKQQHNLELVVFVVYFLLAVLAPITIFNYHTLLLTTLLTETKVMHGLKLLLLLILILSVRASLLF